MSKRVPSPADGRAEYLWWQAGAAANQALHDEGLTNEQKDFRSALEALARQSHLRRHPEDLALILAQIYCRDKLRRRFR
jgi:hypothetical protein